jgi:glutathione peroxidase
MEQNLERSEISIVEERDVNIYDIELNSLDGQENILHKLKGKVTMIVNVTGECANSAQYPIIQNLYDEYKDKGFEVLAVPSIDFCQDAYGEFAESNTSAENMRDHMKELYGTDLPFSEMINILNENCQLSYYEVHGPQHELYEVFQKDTDPVAGNFEKFIIARDGKRYMRFCNSDLLDLGFNNGTRITNSKQALQNIKKAIETFLEEDYDKSNTN